MTLEFRQNDESVVVRLDDVVRLLEPDSDLPNPIHNSRLAGHRVVDRHRRVLARPRKVLERLPLVHVLLNIEHNKVVVHLHLERDPLRPLCPWSTEDKLELDVLRRPTGSRVDRERVLGVGETDGVTTFGGGIDGEDADEDVDGF